MAAKSTQNKGKTFKTVDPVKIAGKKVKWSPEPKKPKSK